MNMAVYIESVTCVILEKEMESLDKVLELTWLDTILNYKKTFYYNTVLSKRIFRSVLNVYDASGTAFLLSLGDRLIFISL